jgi:hypothetical protein
VPGIREMDRIAESFAAADRLAAHKVRVETKLLELELEERARGPLIQHDFSDE